MNTPNPSMSTAAISVFARASSILTAAKAQGLGGGGKRSQRRFGLCESSKAPSPLRSASALHTVAMFRELYRNVRECQT
jgi:hypothetical protein